MGLSFSVTGAVGERDRPRGENSSAGAGGDRLTLYFGGADTVVCMAHGLLSEILASVRA